MALQGLTKSILLYGHQEKGVKVLTSLLCNQLKRYYSTRDPKRITNPIPQTPEDCGCSSQSKQKSSKSKGKGGSSEKQKKSSGSSEKQKGSKTTENEACAEENKKPDKEDTEYCNQAPPSLKACSKRVKQKETECVEEQDYETECGEPQEKEVCEEKAHEMETDCTQPKPEDCTQPKPQQIDRVAPKPKTYPPDCSKLKQAHICDQIAKAKEKECTKSQKAPPAKLKDCCLKKEAKVSSSKSKVAECAKAVQPSKPKGAAPCNPNKSTAFYCAKCVSERKAAEIQSCTDTKKLQDKPKTIQCALGKKSNGSQESKPVCKHRKQTKENEQTKKETCTTKPKKDDCIKPEQCALRKPKIVTINPCGKKACPGKETIEEKGSGKLLKILGIPAVLLLIIGLLYEYGPTPPEAPPTN